MSVVLGTNGYHRMASCETDIRHNFNIWDDLRQACFMPITEAQPHGNYPVTIFEVKKSRKELGVAVNQVVNAGVFIVRVLPHVHRSFLVYSLNICLRYTDSDSSGDSAANRSIF